MTFSSHPRDATMLQGVSSDSEAADSHQSGAGHFRLRDPRAAWRIWGKLVAGIGAVYLLMFNPYWVPGGDSELYIAVGRSWATGHRHTFNGSFVSISPPGWPLVLAGAMKISPTFGFLRLITIVCMTFALGLWYWLLLRFTSPKRAAMITVLTAISAHVYTLSFWMHSDALFCLIVTAAMVLACQINEGRSRLIWRIVALVALCFLSQLVRWAGILQWLVVGGLLLRGHRLPLTVARLKHAFASLLKPAFVAFVLSCVVTSGTFQVVRNALKLTKEQKLAAEAAGATFDEQQQPEGPIETKTVAIINAPSVKTTFRQEMIKRARESGKWFSWLLFPELRFAGGVKILSSLDTVLGWLLIVPIVVAGFVGIKNREWMWLGIGVYCCFLCLNWPNPNARYLVPIMPFLILGLIQGIRILFSAASTMHLGAAALKWSLVAIAVANASLLLVDVAVARSGDFYSYYEGGLDMSLISCMKYLDSRGISDGELGISEVYSNLGRRRPSKFGLRATVMLSDRIVRNVPGKFGDDVNRRSFMRWARSHHIKLYLYQQPISPWRVWHFRLPKWLQETLSREPVAPESAGWVMYRYVSPVSVVVPLPMPRVVTLAPAKWVKVDVPIVHDWPTRVPGM